MPAGYTDAEEKVFIFRELLQCFVCGSNALYKIGDRSSRSSTQFGYVSVKQPFGTTRTLVIEIVVSRLHEPSQQSADQRHASGHNSHSTRPPKRLISIT